jgi:tetratricopeptide (TPR) repeat protein
LGKQRYPEAREAFLQADRDYVGASYWKGGHWDAALDGLTVLDIYESKYDEALTEAKQTIDANPAYESAFYHSAQAEDERFRAFVSGQVPLDVCEAFARASAAQEKYDHLIENNPTFGAAYSQEAIMLAKEFEFVLAHSPPPPKCTLGTINLQELAGTINNQFEMGLARDPDFFNGWYEWGLFLRLLMQERDIPSPYASPESTADAAIDKYDHAIRLVETDSYLSQVNAYFWLRKAEALVKRTKFSNMPDSLRGELLEHARSAHAKYLQLVANRPRGKDGSDESKIEAELQPVVGAVLAGQDDGR